MARQHSEVPSFSPGGKWDAWAAEGFVLTWGDLPGFAPLRERGAPRMETCAVTRAEVSRGRKSWGIEPECA